MPLAHGVKLRVHPVADLEPHRTAVAEGAGIGRTAMMGG